MYKISRNGQRFYAVATEFGPFRNVMDAMREAQRLNELRDSAKTGKLAETDQAQGSPPAGKAQLVQ